MVYSSATKNIPKIFINSIESLTGFFELIDIKLIFVYNFMLNENSDIQNEARAKLITFSPMDFPWILEYKLLFNLVVVISKNQFHKLIQSQSYINLTSVWCQIDVGFALD